MTRTERKGWQKLAQAIKAFESLSYSLERAVATQYEQQIRDAVYRAARDAGKPFNQAVTESRALWRVIERGLKEQSQ